VDLNEKQDVRQNRIRFVLDGEIVSAEITDPTRTILQYLREDLRRTGTKEGCAEGDCGACTVVIGEPGQNGGLQLRAVNSCIQFLPTLNGKLLLTVESLSEPGGPLHPVQQAMVDYHASQCGFCTPGFVMSLFALYKTRRQPDRREIDNSLAGNLCRCTGYRPIIEAARSMYDYEGDGERSWIRRAQRVEGNGAPPDEIRLANVVESIQPKISLSIEAGGRRFFAPVSMTELYALISQYPGALLLAGGTDVGLWVTKRLREPDTVIYLGCVPDLSTIDAGTEYLEIGATVTLTDAMKAICEIYPDLEELFIRFASPPIRNAGTLGGNVANGSPIGDSMPALIVLGTRIVLRRGDVTRELPLDRFYIDYHKNDLHPGEFLQSIRVPVAVPGRLLRSYKISKRFDQDISAVCGAYSLQLGGGIVNDIRVAYGGMAATPRRAHICERTLRDREWTEDTVRSAMKALDDDFAPITDMRASSGYRSTIARNLLYRFFLETSGSRNANTQVYDYGR
jgi:xanthine dehydrogenase small subunit